MGEEHLAGLAVPGRGVRGVPSKTVMHRQPSGACDASPILSVEVRLTEDSISSDRRMTVGPVPCCSTARSASTPASNVRNVKASYRFVSGIGCTRTRTRVTTPNVPSEPMNTSRRSGPAAVAGACRPGWMTPRG